MKPFLICLILAGCASAPQSLPLTVSDGTTLYGQTNATFDHLKAGDLVSYRSKGSVVFAKILEVRGPGVFRVDAPGFVLVTKSNFVSQLFRVDLKP